MRICSLSVPRLKHEWNQTVWSVNNLRCGTAANEDHVHMHIGPRKLKLYKEALQPLARLGRNLSHSACSR